MTNPIEQWANDAVSARLRDGFGDLSAPLADGEYVSEVRTCPHAGCDWQANLEWRHPALGITRLRGVQDFDAMAEAHLLSHLDPAVRDA